MPSFDTQWVERERQCDVGSDGSFEVLRPDGEVVVHHEFADRPVCEREEITLRADGGLVWSDCTTPEDVASCPGQDRERDQVGTAAS